MRNYLTPSITKLKNNTIFTTQPLDLSFRTLEKNIRQACRAQFPMYLISEALELSIPAIYQIIRKKEIIKTKNHGRYTPDVKSRIQEAKRLEISIKKIAEIFNLKKSTVVYLTYSSKKKLRDQLSPFITFPSKTNLNPRLINRLKNNLKKT